MFINALKYLKSLSNRKNLKNRFDNSEHKIWKVRNIIKSGQIAEKLLETFVDKLYDKLMTK